MARPPPSAARCSLRWRSDWPGAARLTHDLHIACSRTPSCTCLRCLQLSWRGADMRRLTLAVLLIGAATLGGCSEGVLDPKGPIAAAERLIMLNSLGIMLAIVIPTILATLGT